MLKKKSQYQQGTSAIELLVASSIILSLSFGVATFLPAGLKSNQRNRDKTVSANLFHQVMEDVENLNYSDLNAGTEEALGSDPIKTLLDTTTKSVTLTSSGSGTVVGGDTVTIGSGSKALTYPKYYRINNTNYRVDIKVVKGKYNDLMAVNSSVDVWQRLENYFAPQAFAAPPAQQPAAVSIEVNPSSKTGYQNTTPFNFTAVCNNCPNANKLEYLWSLDGSALSNQSSVSNYLFGAPGNHTLALSILSKTGNTTSLVGIAPAITLDIKGSSADISYTPANPKVGDTVTFSSTCTDCGGGPVFNWDRGDGTKKTGQSVTFVYDQAGVYTVNLRVTGGSNPYVERSITVAPKPTGPSVDIVATPPSGIAGPPEEQDTTHFSFQLSSSGYKAKPLVLAVNYIVDFGDGSLPTTFLDSDPNDDSLPTFTHTYATASNTPYNVSVQAVPVGVTGQNPGVATTNASTQVLAKDELLLQSDVVEIFAGSSVNFNAVTKGVYDPNPSYNWDFGDRNTSEEQNPKTLTNILVCMMVL